MRFDVSMSPLIEELKLRNNPIIIRVNKFDEASAKEFSEQISKAHNTGQPVIPILIDSFGGYVYSLMSMIADIQHSDRKIATIAVGKAMSCGAALLTFGSDGYRFMDKHATVMIHEVASGRQGKVEEIKASVQETEYLNDKMLKIMAINCGHDENYFINLIHEKKHADWYLTADECLDRKIVNHVRVPQYKATVSVDFKFV